MFIPDVDAEPDGISASKLIFLLASLAASGVLDTPASPLPTTGVLDHAPCAGLGVMFTKSAKLKPTEGVVAPKPSMVDAPPTAAVLVPPGVVIIDEGRGVCLGGGVDGATSVVLVLVVVEVRCERGVLASGRSCVFSLLLLSLMELRLPALAGEGDEAR